MASITKALRFLGTAAVWPAADPEARDRPERRRGTRVNVSESGEVTVVELGVQVGLLLNVSVGGVAIQAVYATKPGDKLSAHFRLPFTDEIIETPCEVAWVDEARQSGFQFIGLDHTAKQRLRAWLAAHDQATDTVADSDSVACCSHAGDHAQEREQISVTMLASADRPAVTAKSAIAADEAAPDLARAGIRREFSPKSYQLNSLVELIMRSIHQVLEQKEMELRQVLHDAVQDKELKLRELQNVLLKADQIVNQLLESDGETSMGGQSGSYTN